MITNKLIIFLSLASFSTGAENSERDDTMNKAIVAFHAQGKATDLDHALLLLNTKIKEMTLGQKAEAYISFASELMIIFDSGFDMKPPEIFMNISPGIGYDSGTSPSAIADPKIRADYERKIADNQKNIKDARVQIMVRKELEKIASACALMLNSNELSLEEQKKITDMISNGKLHKRFKATALSRLEPNKTQNQAGEVNKSK